MKHNVDTFHFSTAAEVNDYLYCFLACKIIFRFQWTHKVTGWKKATLSPHSDLICLGRLKSNLICSFFVVFVGLFFFLVNPAVAAFFWRILDIYCHVLYSSRGQDFEVEPL